MINKNKVVRCLDVLISKDRSKMLYNSLECVWLCHRFFQNKLLSATSFNEKSVAEPRALQGACVAYPNHALRILSFLSAASHKAVTGRMDYIVQNPILINTTAILARIEQGVNFKTGPWKPS
jgi:hypothetical protein